MIKKKGLEVSLSNPSDPRELDKAYKRLQRMVDDEDFPDKTYHETRSQKRRRKRKKNAYLRKRNER